MISGSYVPTTKEDRSTSTPQPEETLLDWRPSACVRTVSGDGAGYINVNSRRNLTLAVHNIWSADRYRVPLDDWTEWFNVLLQYNNAPVAKILFHYCCAVATCCDFLFSLVFSPPFRSPSWCRF